MGSHVKGILQVPGSNPGQPPYLVLGSSLTYAYRLCLPSRTSLLDGRVWQLSSRRLRR